MTQLPGKALKANKKYLIARPKGGFNDSLVQLEKAREYASSFDRHLVVDFSHCGIRITFEDLFEPKESFGCVVLDYSDELALDLAEIYARDKNVAAAEARDWIANSSTIRSFDMRIAHTDCVLIHEAHGGGGQSVRLLSHVSLTPQFARQTMARLNELPIAYDALHVRHTDYETDFERFFARLVPAYQGRHIILCTDSRVVQRYAQNVFVSAESVELSSTLPADETIPIHKQRATDPAKEICNILTDLGVIVLADTFLFTGVSAVKGKKLSMRFSGFSKLGYRLRMRPDIFAGLFPKPDQGLLLKRVSRRPAKNTDADHQRFWRRRICLIWERLWNWPAYETRRRARRKLYDI